MRKFPVWCSSPEISTSAVIMIMEKVASVTRCTNVVVSPMHASVIPDLDIAHPARIWSKPEPNVFMIMEADKETLHATWINMAGEKLHDFKVTAAELRA
jgi:hypothetical protein